MQPQPRVFHYSLDWRFLLPIAKPQEIYVLAAEGDEFHQTLEQVGIASLQQLSLVDLRQSSRHDLQTVVMPFGVASSWVTPDLEDQVKVYSTVRNLLATQGRLLVGFNNVWGPRGTQAKYYPSTPRRIRVQLNQAGFTSVQLHGVMPNLDIPQYIFGLEPRSIHFALQNRFRRKPAILRALRLVAASIGMLRVSNFLPCYFAVATV